MYTISASLNRESAIYNPPMPPPSCLSDEDVLAFRLYFARAASPARVTRPATRRNDVRGPKAVGGKPARVSLWAAIAYSAAAPFLLATLIRQHTEMMIVD
jgi:hypothetical protein